MTQLAQWQIKDFDPGKGPAPDAAWDNDGWIEATAPGDVYASLIAANRIGHPYAGRNEAKAAWIGEREWRWRTRFEAKPVQAGERVELVFDGLDTFADIYLNGKLVGSAGNMFHDWRYDVAALLRQSNELVVVFKPTGLAVAAREMPQWGPLSDKMNVNKRNLMRKAQFGWGWDWGPTLPTVGLWRAVRLERWSAARLDDVHARVTSLSAERCELRVDVSCDAPSADLSAKITLRDPEGFVAATTAVLLVEAASVSLDVGNPRIWWTADLGKQPLYKLEVELLQGGKALDRREMKLGLRTIAIDQSPDPDEPGATFFRFVLNGVPIFARGACWIPASSFVGVVDRAHYAKLLDQALRANMNMMRIWGGGVYEHDEFYDLCDEMGMLVWQDFMFACAPYPEDDARLNESIRTEIRYQLRRLRHHPSMALWCGNNECQVLQEVVDMTLGKKAPLMGALFYDEMMPQEVAQLDPTTPYWPGSPWGGAIANSMRIGDVHDWTVWHGVPPVPDDKFIGTRDLSPAGVHYKRYAEDQARFVSEFGIHSSPTLASLKRWMNADDLKLEAEGFLERIKDEPKIKVYSMLEPVTGLPKNLEQYVDYTMLLQAEGLKYGIEHFRRRKPHCSGTLIWQLNDCWPCVSWSLMDYDGDGKASLYAVGRAYAPVLASFKELDGDGVELWITNDTLHPVKGTAIVELLRFAGATDWSVEVPYSVPANASQPVWRGEVKRDAADVALHVRAKDDGFAPNRYLPAPIMNLQLARGAKPKVAIKPVSANELEVRVSADAWLLMVSLETADAGARYSDNYFDLRPGESRTIRVTNAGRAIAAGDLTVRCWNEAH